MAQGTGRECGDFDGTVEASPRSESGSVPGTYWQSRDLASRLRDRESGLSSETFLDLRPSLSSRELESFP